jgi:hypothetical protein
MMLTLFQISEPGIVVQSHNPSTREAGQEDCEFEASLGYIHSEILLQKNNNKSFRFQIFGLGMFN